MANVCFAEAMRSLAIVINMNGHQWLSLSPQDGYRFGFQIRHDEDPRVIG